MDSGASRWRRLRRALGLLAVVISVPALAALASDRFEDVPATHVFHDDIAWLADQGITRGCNPPANSRFCPEDPVTRGQMAAFMHRLADGLEGGVGSARVAGATGPLRLLGDDAWTTLVSATISAPSAGALLVDGGASLFVENITDAGGAGLIAATTAPTCSDTMDAFGATWSTANPAGTDSAAVNGVLAVPRGTVTVRLCGWAIHVDTFERTEAITSTLSAVWFPSGLAASLGDETREPVSEPVARLRERALASD